MSSPGTLRVVEPQMDNLFHSPFNAALLHTAVLAYPQTSIVFQAQHGHLEAVRQIMQEHAPGIMEHIVWEPLPVSARGSLARRWWSARAVLEWLLATGDRLLFCSISRLQLLTLKQLMRPADTARCVLHGDLESVEDAERFPQSLLSLRHALETRQPRGLRYILLSRSIRQSLPEPLQRGMGEVGVVDHPYQFSPLPPAIPQLRDGLVFGIFGNTGDARSLEYVARAVRSKWPEIRFRCIGFLENEATVQRIADVVEGGTATPIARERFQHDADTLTHALWLAEPEGFRLRASGTFFDALLYRKPIVYTANPYLDSYGIAEAGIGWRCASLEGVVAACLRIADDTQAPDAQRRYEAQVERLGTFRERFTPEALAADLRGALKF